MTEERDVFDKYIMEPLAFVGSKVRKALNMMSIDPAMDDEFLGLFAFFTGGMGAALTMGRGGKGGKGSFLRVNRLKKYGYIGNERPGKGDHKNYDIFRGKNKGKSVSIDKGKMGYGTICKILKKLEIPYEEWNYYIKKG